LNIHAVALQGGNEAEVQDSTKGARHEGASTSKVKLRASLGGFTPVAMQYYCMVSKLLDTIFAPQLLMTDTQTVTGTGSLCNILPYIADFDADYQ